MEPLDGEAGGEESAGTERTVAEDGSLEVCEGESEVEPERETETGRLPEVRCSAGI